MSKPVLTTLAAACALVLPAVVQSRPVTLTTTLKNYGGDGAYLAVYLTDAKGAYAGTLWVAGGKAKYYKNLSDWNRLSASDTKRLQGITGASVGQGRTLKVTADLADALIDAGYEIRVPLSSADAGKAQAGRQYIQSFSFQLQ